VAHRETREEPPGSRFFVAETLGHPEPLGPDLNTLADWLRQRLQSESGIEASVLTGSWLDLTTTRWSDIDLVIMVKHDPNDKHWIDLGRNLRNHIPKL
jgi:hypothetical protein